MIYKENAILRHLRQRGPLTRSDLALDLDLPKPTLVRLSSDLCEKGLIHDVGQADAPRGRPAQLLDINPQFGSLIGVEVAANRVVGLVSDLRGQVLAEAQQPLQLIDDECAEKRVLDTVDHVITKLLASRRGKGPQFRGIGIAVPGQLDLKRGVVVTLPHLRRWRNVPLAARVSRKFKLPCLLQPNSVAAALGEYEYGLARGISHALCINLNENLGMGVILNGQVLTGATGNVGELGHIRIPAPALQYLESHGRCYCGGIGCVETRLSRLAMVAAAHRAMAGNVDSVMASLVNHDPTAVDFNTIVTAARQGDKLAHAIVHEFAEFFGQVLAEAVNLFNPERIILDGILIDMAELIMTTIQNGLKLNALECSAACTQLVLSQMQGRAAALGATVPLLDSVLNASAAQ